MKKHTIFLAVLFSTLLPLAAGAATRLVSPSGADAGDCTALPCLTIGYAAGQAVDGDTVSVAAGTYAEEVAVSKKLAFSGAGNDGTVIDVLPGSYAFVIADGTSDVAISGFRIEGNANSAAPQEGGVLIEAPNLGISNVTVTGNTFFGLDNGFESRGELTNITVSDNLFDKLTDWSAIEVTTLNMGSGLPYTVDGIRITGNEIRNSLGVPIKLSNYTRASASVMKNLEITGNSIHDNNGQASHMENWTGGIALRHGAVGVTITGNDVRDNLNLSGINIAGTGTYDELTVTGNYLAGNVGCDRSPFSAAEHAAGIKFRSITGPVTYTMEGNSIVGNDEGANNNGAAVLKMWDNYWGCAAGPGASGCDTVTGALDVSPWLGGSPAVSVNIDPSSGSLMVSQTLNLVVTADRLGGATDDITSECSFESNDAAIATVDANGLVTAVAPGSVRISAECADEGTTVTVNSDITVGAVDTGESEGGEEEQGGQAGDAGTTVGGTGEEDEFAGLKMGGGCSMEIVRNDPAGAFSAYAYLLFSIALAGALRIRKTIPCSLPKA